VARRRTLSPPGRTPSASQPRCTHSCMTAQIRSSPPSTSALSRRASSLASISLLMGRLVRAAYPSSSAPLPNG
jgi:hypothetical protein